MDWQSMLFEVCAVAFLVAVGRYLIPYIKAQAADVKWGKFLEMVDIVVGAADQIAKNFGYDHVWKKEYVVEQLGIYLKKAGLTVETAVLDSVIENAVLVLHNSLK